MFFLINSDKGSTNKRAKGNERTYESIFRAEREKPKAIPAMPEINTSTIVTRSNIPKFRLPIARVQSIYASLSHFNPIGCMNLPTYRNQNNLFEVTSTL